MIRKSEDSPGYTYGIGTRVLVTDALDRSELTGKHGVIVSLNEIEGMEDLELRIPEIKLDNGGVIFGYECWWIPELVAAEAETRAMLDRNDVPPG